MFTPNVSQNVLGVQGHHRNTITNSGSYYISQIVLALSVGIPKLLEPGCEPFSGKRHDARIYLCDHALCGRRVVFFDDSLDPPGLVAHDATVSFRINQRRREEVQGAVSLRYQPSKCRKPNERNIPIQHQYLTIATNMRKRLLERVPGTELGFLQSEAQIGLGQAIRHSLATMPIDHAYSARPERARRVDHVLD